MLQMEKAPLGKRTESKACVKKPITGASKVESQPKARKIGVNITCDARKGLLSKEGW